MSQNLKESLFSGLGFFFGMVCGVNKLTILSWEFYVVVIIASISACILGLLVRE